ncbi:ATP-binding protein [Thermoclostridium caenicola]|uniref:endopeptidase La n=1 Tax=Thermoclostridium caenicola TaxID=659425 RepID=A0A1M6I845_9FIRM|nr:ATP-binding protein [Thermoclostridium caenicola]SHJ30528.1 lon-related putative ATP-dependent protease [Thermoclostridium caenicola]HOP72072.1 ATP-binding protein [Thermoclostridium caenicola]
MPVEPLPAKALRRECDPSLFDFEHTGQLPPTRELIGQQRAVEATEFGLAIQLDGYNIYMAGESGEGKTRYALECAQKQAKHMPVPDDWCYVYNFEDATRPRAINLPAGMGREFKKDMEEFVRIIEQEMDKAFNGDEYEAERTRIIKRFRERKDELVMKLSQEAQERGFRVKLANSGIYFMPLVDGEPISEDEFNQLDEDIKIELTKSSEALQAQTGEIIRKIRELETEAEEAIKKWEHQIALYAVGIHIDSLKEKYMAYPAVVGYLNEVRSDILDNVEALVGDDYGDDQQTMFLQMMARRGAEENPYDRYKVNLLVDNSHLKGAPVIVDYNPTYYNLMGRCEYENEFGTMTTDYTMIKPGLFHQANGGFLILQINDVLSNPQSFEAIKRTLKTRQIIIENIKEQMGLVAVSALKPEPIPVNVKIILVGSSEIYHLLYHFDRDFKKFFKIKAEFDDQMDWNQDNVNKIARFISAFCNKEGIPHFDRTGVAEVVNYCSWLVQDQTKLTTRFSEIVNILGEAGTWASIQNSDLVTGLHVKKAIREKMKRSNKYDEELLELVRDGTIMIDTDGWVVGQINGLSVIELGDYTFGKPARITAATYMGKAGIVDIEREVETGGYTHSKGVLILSGYIGRKYAQDIPLSLTASICFEQTYSGIDGDSASSTELYAILSSLADLPINQGIAVTGSVNQLGMIQPIGGASFKIQGFFNICKINGLTGRQGVIIPRQNIKNLVLNDEVVKAVEEGMFHIYPVSTVDEGIEILTGVSAGEKLPDGTYPENTVHGRVYRKLRHYAETAAKYKE